MNSLKEELVIARKKYEADKDNSSAKIEAIKAIRNMLGCSLFEAKTIVEYVLKEYNEE
jgi:ribosomal protein L7/L12